MAEIWDIYDGEGNKTGATMQRGEVPAGSYMLCVHVYLHTSDGKYLVQKRAMTKESHPGVWDITGGAVLHNEESLDGARRETLEEVGLDITKGDITFIGRIKKRRSFADVYFVKMDFSLSDCTVQKEEVDDIKFVDGEELLKLQLCERLRDEDYMEVITKAVRENNSIIN